MWEEEMSLESSQWNIREKPSVHRGFWVYVIAIWYTLTGLGSLSNLLKAATPAPGSHGHIQIELFPLITTALIAICLCVGGVSLFLQKRIALGAFCSAIAINIVLGIRNLIINGTWISSNHPIAYGLGILGVLAASAYTYYLSRQGKLN
jgi:hypothetical protein